ncbi:MAG TPA: sulfite exporter TauE/SafE family protein, partial [Sinomonas sp.]|nr:sulfite exporter TauE/SafE family protein [Sinomonas sp.]
MQSGFELLDPLTLALVVAAGFGAGWVDAVVGGGGLIQLPA